MIDAGYIIYDNDYPDDFFKFDKSISERGDYNISFTPHTNRQELVTFGQVPYVYYVGNTNYVSFELTTVFIKDEVTKESALSQYNRFKKMIDKRKGLIVENSANEKFVCDVQIVNSSQPKMFVKDDMDYKYVKVKCTQIDI